MSNVIFRLENKRVWVAGHRGMVGSALVRRLEHENCEIITSDRSRVDLRDQSQVKAWITETKPQVVFLAAAKVGGILANDTYPADFLYENLMIQTNVIHSAFKAGTGKLLFPGSSCISPKCAAQPIPEDALLTGPLEPTNAWYAIAKIAGIKLCQAYRKQHGSDFISAMPTNLYGIGDNFDFNNSHVVPALIRRAHEAKSRGDSQLVIWGSGTPRREFLYADDCADALVMLMKSYSGATHINVGTGEDVTILELAKLVAEIVGFSGVLVTDPSKPDGTPRKLLDVTRLRALDWSPMTSLRQGLQKSYAWYLDR